MAVVFFDEFWWNEIFPREFLQLFCPYFFWNTDPVTFFPVWFVQSTFFPGPRVHFSRGSATFFCMLNLRIVAFARRLRRSIVFVVTTILHFVVGTILEFPVESSFKIIFDRVNIRVTLPNFDRRLETMRVGVGE